MDHANSDYAAILRPFLAGADHVDSKEVHGQVNLEQFLLGMLAYYPWWLELLYKVRGVLAKILGLTEPPEDKGFDEIIPRQISFTPGDTALFFTIRDARQDSHWIAETPVDKHLKAYVAVLYQPSASSYATFKVITIVHYLHWTGPVYFNLIRPFHHLVVSRMARAGTRAGNKEGGTHET